MILEEFSFFKFTVRNITKKAIQCGVYRHLSILPQPFIVKQLLETCGKYITSRLLKQMSGYCYRVLFKSDDDIIPRYSHLLGNHRVESDWRKQITVKRQLKLLSGTRIRIDRYLVAFICIYTIYYYIKINSTIYNTTLME